MKTKLGICSKDFRPQKYLRADPHRGIPFAVEVDRCGKGWALGYTVLGFALLIWWLLP